MSRKTIAVIGSGIIGRTLATRWAEAGHAVTFGTRTPEDPDLLAFATGLGASVAGINRAIESSDVVLLAINGAAMEHAVAAMGSVLDGKIVIDAANNIGAPTANSLALISGVAPGAHAFRAFNSLGWENFADPDYEGGSGDLLYTGPTGPSLEVVESLIGDTGLRPIRVGDNDKADLVDGFTRLWFTLAFERGWGRGLGFRILHRQLGD